MAGISASELYAINPNIPSAAYSLPKLLWRRKAYPGFVRGGGTGLSFLAI